MRLRYRFVVFDLDGTLVDTRADLAASTNHVRRSFGLEPIAPESVYALVGHGARALVARALGEDRPELHEEGVRRFLVHYGEHCLDASVSYPGLAELLPRLAREGASLAVLTNKPELLSRKILEGLGLSRSLLAVVGGDTLPVRKPDPAGLDHLRGLAGHGREETLLVGDSRIDVETAERGAVDACGVLWGLDPEGLASAAPNHLARDVAELEAVILP